MGKLAIEQFSALVEGLYDAALHQERWRPMLEELSQVLGACFGGFGWENTRIMAVGGSHGTQKLEGKEAERYRETYKRTLVYSNPLRVPVLLTQKVDDVYTISMLISTQEYHASRYYQEYIKPMGWDHGLSSVISKEDGVVHFLAFARRIGEDPFDEDDLYNLKLLAPHIRRAYTIGNLIGKQKAQVSALAETFDGLSAAVFLLAEGSRVTYLNDSARALLARGEALAVSNGVLGAIEAEDRAVFHNAFAAAAQPDAFNHWRSESLRLQAGGKDQYVAHFLPLLGGKPQNREAFQAAVAALFVSKAALDTRSPIEVISRAFGLTPREMSVLVAIIEFDGVTEVAAQLGLTVNTVKSHLKMIFEKTGVSRQTALVKLVASYVSPAEGGAARSKRKIEN